MHSKRLSHKSHKRSKSKSKGKRHSRSRSRSSTFVSIGDLYGRDIPLKYVAYTSDGRPYDRREPKAKWLHGGRIWKAGGRNYLYYFTGLSGGLTKPLFRKPEQAERFVLRVLDAEPEEKEDAKLMTDFSPSYVSKEGYLRVVICENTFGRNALAVLPSEDAWFDWASDYLGPNPDIPRSVHFTQKPQFVWTTDPDGDPVLFTYLLVRVPSPLSMAA